MPTAAKRLDSVRHPSRKRHAGTFSTPSEATGAVGVPAKNDGRAGILCSGSGLRHEELAALAGSFASAKIWSATLQYTDQYTERRRDAIPRCNGVRGRSGFARRAGCQQSAPVSETQLLEGDDETYAEADGPRFNLMAAEAARSWRWMVDVWTKAPSELRIMTFLLPILLALAVSPSMPKVKVANAAGKDVQKMVADRWSTLNKSIVNRAAVAYSDDFRSGLDGWESRSNLTTRWSYDASGFVQPGPLAVFRPSVDLTDYRFEFLGEIDKKGMGCAFRAPDLDNYYAVKFLVVRAGPLPEVHVVRYAVIGGKEGPRVERPLPFVTRTDMLYRIRVDVRGSDFAIRAQDQIVDFWSDNRIPRGGVGLFCGRGEKARVRWLEVSHQYDTLGRFCAYLAPYGFEGRNGNFN